MDGYTQAVISSDHNSSSGITNRPYAYTTLCCVRCDCTGRIYRISWVIRRTKLRMQQPSTSIAVLTPNISVRIYNAIYSYRLGFQCPPQDATRPPQRTVSKNAECCSVVLSSQERSEAWSECDPEEAVSSSSTFLQWTAEDFFRLGPGGWGARHIPSSTPSSEW